MSGVEIVFLVLFALWVTPTKATETIPDWLSRVGGRGLVFLLIVNLDWGALMGDLAGIVASLGTLYEHIPDKSSAVVGLVIVTALAGLKYYRDRKPR